MCKRIQRLLISLCTLVTFVFAQDSTDVTLTLQSNGNLDYDSSADIYGFQFATGGCTTGAGGGDAEANGFTVQGGDGSTVLGFSFSGSFIPAGSGTLLVLEGDITEECLSDFLFSDSEANALVVGL